MNYGSIGMNIKKKKVVREKIKKDIQLGQKSSVLDQDFDPKKGKGRVNMMIDLDILDAIRKMAKNKHTGYQTLINQMLRESVLCEVDLESRVAKLEKVVRKIAG
jgi:uncharacterized protein (DUF4415 family)